MEREAPALKTESISGSKHNGINQSPPLFSGSENIAHLDKEKSVMDAWLKRREFLIDIENRGVDIPDIIKVINFTSPTEADLARQLETTRAVIDARYRSRMIRLWNNADGDIKSKYSLSDLASARKPMSISKRRENSVAHGGHAVSIEKAFVEDHARSRQEFEQSTGLSGGKLNSAVATAREWGNDIPKKYQELSAIKRKLDEAENDEQKHSILHNLAPNSLRRLSRLHPDTFTTLRAVLEDGGYHIQSGSKEFQYARSLIEKSKRFFIKRIPVKVKGKIVAHQTVLLKKEKSEAIALLDSDSELNKHKINPVGKLWGEDDSLPMPTYSDLVDSDKYGRLGLLTKQVIGIKLGGSAKTSFKAIFDGCPVPLYCYGSGGKYVYFYPKPREQDVIDFLNRKYQLTIAQNPL